MKRKTIYEWRLEYYRDGDGSACDMDWADKLQEFRISSLDGYGHPDDDDVLDGWTVALVKRVFYDHEESWHAISLDDVFYYLEPVDGKLQFDQGDGKKPKRFMAELEKFNKELA